MQAKLEQLHRQFAERIDRELDIAMEALDGRITQLVERKRQLLEARLIQPPASILAPTVPPTALAAATSVEPKYTIKC
jgi:hypothetical protein